MKPGSSSDTLVPPGMLAQIQTAADEEQRAPMEIVREALERYMEDREWNKLFAYGEERALALGLTENDVLRLIAEARQEKRQGHDRRVFDLGDFADEEIALIARAEVPAEHPDLDKGTQPVVFLR